MLRVLSSDEANMLLRSRGLTELELRPVPRGEYVLHGGPATLPSLRLDHGVPAWERAVKLGKNGASGFIVDGDLTIAGNLVNGEQDFGPALIVFGNLRVRNVAIAGAPLIVRGDLDVDEAFHGYYNHGYLNVEGNVRARAFVASEYFGQVGGRVIGAVLDKGHVEAKFESTDERAEDVLVDEVFVAEDDETEGEEKGTEPPSRNDGAIFARLERGQPVVRGGGPTEPCRP